MKDAAGFQDRVVAAVKSIEECSSIEVVVSLSPRSITPAVPILASALVTCISILIIYPIFFANAEPLTVTADIFIISALSALMTATLPPLQRLFLPARRLHEAAVTAAGAAFVRQGIHCTLRRSGMLVYLSVFERQVLLVPDIGVRAMIPADEMKALEKAAAIYTTADPDAQMTIFFELLQRAAARYMPKTADDINELPDKLERL